MNLDYSELQEVWESERLLSITLEPISLMVIIANMQLALTHAENKTGKASDMARCLAESFAQILTAKFPRIKHIIESGWTRDTFEIHDSKMKGEPSFKMLIYSDNAGNICYSAEGPASEIGVGLRTAIQENRSIRAAVLGSAVDYCRSEGIDLNKLVETWFPEGFEPSKNL